MFYFHPNQHIRFCVYQKEAIILDLKIDRYIFLMDGSDLFLYILQNGFEQKDGVFIPTDSKPPFTVESINAAIADLRKAKILAEKGSPNKYSNTIHNSDEGMSNINWVLTSNLRAKAKTGHLIAAYYLLVKTFAIIKLRGFYTLVEIIRHTKTHKASQKHDIYDLVVALNKACSFFPVKVKCLEWAAALYFLAKKNGLDCQFTIGVQNYPFRAHAWVEHQNKIIGDAENLDTGLAIMLSEPSTI
jgi:hypothetical protein